MGDISGKVYIILGIAVAAISLVLNITSKSSSMTIFIVAGVLMFVFGLFKVLSKTKESNEAHDKHLRGEHKKNVQQDKSPNLHHKQSHSGAKEPYHEARYCPKCANGLGLYDNFCANCGFRVR